MEEIEQVNRFAVRGLRPDLTFLLDLPTAVAAERAGESDRFEEEGDALQEAVLATYERLIEAEPERWRRLDAMRPPEQLHADVLAAVEQARG